jgi:hypothetical protein
MKETEKKYHSLPQFYLDGFANTESNQLWVYEKGNPGSWPSSALAEGRRNFYRVFFKDHGGEERNPIEEYLARIERRARTLIEGVHKRNRFSDIHKMELALFLSFMLTRVPLFGLELEKRAVSQTDHIGINRTVNHFGTALETFQKELGIELDFSEYDLVEQSSSRGAIESLSHMFSIAYAVFPKLVKLKWRFLFSNPGIEYITSDNPMYFYIQSSTNDFMYSDFLQSDLDLTIPLSSKVALLAKPQGIEPGYGDAHDLTVRSINKRTVISAISQVFSNIKSSTLDKLVQQNRNSELYAVLMEQEETDRPME